MAIRFISDIHLEQKRPSVTRAFLRYLDELPADTQALYLLGDIFEAWLGDDDDDPFLHNIRDALKSVTSRGIPVFFMHGNRDFLVGAQFAEQTGCTLLNDPAMIEHAGQQYLLMHGDSLCTDDTEYQNFRLQIRNPAMQAMLLAKPLDERREIARQLRAGSKMANSNKAQNIMDVNAQAVAAIMQQYPANTLIHGHTHRPAIHALADGKQRVVLGDWEQNGWDVVLDNGSLTLNHFPINP